MEAVLTRHFTREQLTIAMQDSVPTFRVAPAYVRCLGQQAVFGGLGILTGWVVFLAVSLWLLPVSSIGDVMRLPWRLFTDHQLWMTPTQDEIRELIRFGMGVGLAICAVLGGLADISSWHSVRYECDSDSLSMCWRGLRRRILWELINTVDERPHEKAILSSLKITQNGTGVILVRGLETMPEFIKALRSHLPRVAKWTVSPGTLDLTRRLTNFAFGVLLMLPLCATWVAYYIWGSRILGLLWSVALLPAAFWIWFQKPASRLHFCAREVEVLMAFLLLILSGALTLLSWLDSSMVIPAPIARWLF